MIFVQSMVELSFSVCIHVQDGQPSSGRPRALCTHRRVGVLFSWCRGLVQNFDTYNGSEVVFFFPDLRSSTMAICMAMGWFWPLFIACEHWGVAGFGDSKAKVSRGLFRSYVVTGSLSLGGQQAAGFVQIDGVTLFTGTSHPVVKTQQEFLNTELKKKKKRMPGALGVAEDV